MKLRMKLFYKFRQVSPSKIEKSCNLIKFPKPYSPSSQCKSYAEYETPETSIDLSTLKKLFDNLILTKNLYSLYISINSFLLHYLYCS